MRKCKQLKQQFCIINTQNPSNFEASNLVILYFNIRSSTRNCENLQNYHTTYNFCSSIIVLSEAWQYDSTEVSKPTGYKRFFSRNGENRSSGVAIFVCNTMKVIDKKFNSKLCSDNKCLRLQGNSEKLSTNAL